MRSPLPNWAWREAGRIECQVEGLLDLSELNADTVPVTELRSFRSSSTPGLRHSMPNSPRERDREGWWKRTMLSQSGSGIAPDCDVTPEEVPVWQMRREPWVPSDRLPKHSGGNR